MPVVSEKFQLTFASLQSTIEKIKVIQDNNKNISNLNKNSSYSVQDYINKLKILLENDDTKSEVLIEKIIEMVKGSNIEKKFILIQNDISNIEYDEALEKIMKIDIGEI